MNRDKVVDAIAAMRGTGVQFSKPLSGVELESAEARFQFHFPPELRTLLQLATPIGTRFPNWRDLHSEALAQQMAWPIDGICFDVEHNDFWVSEWGHRPRVVSEAVALAKSVLLAAPPMVPIYGHRYLPSEPHAEGNPVLSMYQSDIIYYGSDLWDYIHIEFGHTQRPSPGSSARDVPFWSTLVQ